MQGTKEVGSAAASVRIFNIAVIGNPILRKFCYLADQETLPQVIADLKEVCGLLHGAGFAANQLGYLSRVCVVVPPHGKMYVMVNPVIKAVSEEKISGREACFSIPGYTSVVERYAKILVVWIDEFRTVQEGWCEGDEARFVQHEIDHLNGKLISDTGHFGANKLKGIDRKYRKQGSVIHVSELGDIV